VEREVVDDDWNDVEEKVSCNLLSCIDWSSHACD
jgi:hypothetical protein